MSSAQPRLPCSAYQLDLPEACAPNAHSLSCQWLLQVKAARALEIDCSVWGDCRFEMVSHLSDCLDTALKLMIDVLNSRPCEGEHGTWAEWGWMLATQVRPQQQD